MIEEQPRRASLRPRWIIVDGDDINELIWYIYCHRGIPRSTKPKVIGLVQELSAVAMDKIKHSFLEEPFELQNALIHSRRSLEYDTIDFEDAARCDENDIVPNRCPDCHSSFDESSLAEHKGRTCEANPQHCPRCNRRWHANERSDWIWHMQHHEFEDEIRDFDSRLQYAIQNIGRWFTGPGQWANEMNGW